MKLSNFLVLLLIITSFACDKLGDTYKKAKNKLGLDSSGSFILSQMNYKEKDFDTSFEKEFMEDEQIIEQYKEKKAETIKEVAENKNLNSDKATQIAQLKAEIELLRFENDRMRLAGGVENSNAVKSVTRSPASLAYSYNAINPKILNTNPEKKYKEAEQLFKQGRVNKAKINFLKFIEEFPYTSYTGVSYFWLGEIYMMDKDYLSAIDSYMQSAYLSYSRQRQSINFLKIAEAYKLMSRHKLAESYFKKVLKIFPDSKYGEIALKELSK